MNTIINDDTVTPAVGNTAESTKNTELNNSTDVPVGTQYDLVEEIEKPVRKRYIRLPQVLELIPVAPSTWWAGIKLGRFPKGVKIGPKTTAWAEDDIIELMKTLSGE